MMFRRRFKNVKAHRWYPKFIFSDAVRVLFNETNEIMKDIPWKDPPPFRPVADPPIGPICHDPLGYWHAQSEDGENYWCVMEQKWRALP